MYKKLFLSSAVALLIAISGTAQSDDTDVYLNVGSGAPTGSEPMVMFSLDYRANLGSTACNGDTCDTLIKEGYMSPTGPYTFFDVLRGAIRKVFDPLEDVRVGLMLNHDHRANCAGFGETGCSNGGYIAMGFELFEVGDANGAKARFHAILDSLPIPQGTVSHSYQGKELFFEFFRYLTGQGVYNAHNGYIDYGSKDTKVNLDVDLPAASWDTTIEKPPASKPNYVSPLSSAGVCSKIFTINPLFLVSSQEDDSDLAIEAAIVSGGFGTVQNQFPDVLQYLNDADLADGNYGTAPDLDDKQNVTSYFIVDRSFVNNTTIGYARAGGTGAPLPITENPDDIVDTLQEIFKQILSVSTTFVAASVPVNVFNRAEITDNVYIALFQAGQRPSWVGNVKKLKLVGGSSSTAAAVLVDALGSGAIGADGRIRFGALTPWTLPESLPPADTSVGEVDGRDGRSVPRGGAGQRVPGFLSQTPHLANGLGGRTIYYDTTPTLLADFDANAGVAAELQSAFGASNPDESAELIAFARGIDIDDDDADKQTNEAREWIFGDPMHSRPLPLNYGAWGGYGADNPAIFIAVASNDGMLHMLRNKTTGGAESGEEIWAFMPKTSLPAQKTLRDNATAASHPYTVDGAPVAYIADVNANGTIDAGEKVYLYVGLRRGGKKYYALDVSNPESPRLMWTLTKSGDFSELGYTFSNPRVGLLDWGSGKKPVIMFAGGYDMNKDSRSGVGTDDTEGNAIYVVDAETGNLVWKAVGGAGGSSSKVFKHSRLVDSIPSTLTVADTDGDDLTDRIIVGDTGGNVWRADLKGTSTADWKLTLLASVGRHSAGASGTASDRRFFHRPDLVLATDDSGNFDAVLMGTGDRADPLDGGGTATNFFYMIKDRNTAPGSGADDVYDHSDFGDVTSNCLQEGSCIVNLDSGWRLQMEDSGEKILATPLTVTGKVFFTSYLPKGGSSATACSPSEGAGRLYALSLQDGSSVINYDTTDDDPGNPDEPTTKSDRSTDLNSAGIPAEVVTVPPNKILRPDLQIDNVDVKTRWRTYWYLQEDVDQ